MSSLYFIFGTCQERNDAAQYLCRFFLLSNLMLCFWTFLDFLLLQIGYIDILNLIQFHHNLRFLNTFCLVIHNIFVETDHSLHIPFSRFFLKENMMISFQKRRPFGQQGRFSDTGVKTFSIEKWIHHLGESKMKKYLRFFFFLWSLNKHYRSSFHGT